MRVGWGGPRNAGDHVTGSLADELATLRAAVDDAVALGLAPEVLQSSEETQDDRPAVVRPDRRSHGSGRGPPWLPLDVPPAILGSEAFSTPKTPSQHLPENQLQPGSDLRRHRCFTGLYGSQMRFWNA